MVREYHEMSMRETGVTNTKTGQDHLSVSGPLGRESSDGGLNQGQLIAGNPAGIPAGLPRHRLFGRSKDEGLEGGRDKVLLRSNPNRQQSKALYRPASWKKCRHCKQVQSWNEREIGKKAVSE